MESIEVWIAPAILIAGLGFIWKMLEKLREDITSVRERMAKIEGKVDVLTEAFVDSIRSPALPAKQAKSPPEAGTIHG